MPLSPRWSAGRGLREVQGRRRALDPRGRRGCARVAVEGVALDLDLPVVALRQPLVANRATITAVGTGPRPLERKSDKTARSANNCH